MGITRACFVKVVKEISGKNVLLPVSNDYQATFTSNNFENTKLQNRNLKHQKKKEKKSGLQN